MAKSRRKKRKSRTKKRFFSKKKILILLLSFLGAFAIVYIVNHVQSIGDEKLNDKSTQTLMSKMQKMLDDEKRRVDSLPKQIKPKEPNKISPIVEVKQKEIEKETHLSEVEDYKASLEKQKQKSQEPKRIAKKAVYSGKPRLAIIIDDVAFAHQVRLIKKIPFRVTPSFFPPTKNHPNSIELAKDFNFAMVHLPLEALNHGRPEPQTLKANDTAETIKKRVQQIKEWFPYITHYNNHTGSKFTADPQAMDRLMKILKDNNITFMDSRTTKQTKAPQMAKKYNLKLYTRDIFLDNSTQKSLIREQLKKAVAIAKKSGYAVAIGHPNKNTLSVLMNAQDLLKGIDLVYLKDL